MDVHFTFLGATMASDEYEHALQADIAAAEVCLRKAQIFYLEHVNSSHEAIRAFAASQVFRATQDLIKLRERENEALREGTGNDADVDK